MFLVFDDRPSDSPFIERIWTAYSKRADEFLSVAAGHWEMVVTRYATDLLREGVATLDVVHTAGYFDQAHLTRALRDLIGQTPGEIAKRTRQLSFLYKTTPVR
jgi:hypothetical protein